MQNYKEVKLSLQSIAAKIMFKLPDPLLGKIMKFLSPKKDTPELDPMKYWHLQEEIGLLFKSRI